MDFEKRLQMIAKSYEDEGYSVVVHPAKDQMPRFAAEFDADLIATRASDCVLVEVKQDRADLESDPKVVKLAEIVQGQPGWRYDLHILGDDNELRRTALIAGEPTEEQIEQMVKQAETLLFALPMPAEIKARSPGIDETVRQHAFLQAWAALEAAMRHASVEDNGNGSPIFSPTVLIRQLYGNGLISAPEFQLIESNRQIRNSIVHGFGPIQVHANQVASLAALTRKLLSAKAGVAA